jgi:glyoxylase I family protein
VLRVSDLARSIEFYRDVLGCPVERRVDELGLVQLRAGHSLIDLVDAASRLGKAGGDPAIARGPNMDHFAISVAHFDEAAIRAHLARFGVEATETQRLYGAEGYGPSIYLRDPDGNRVELKGPSDGGSESNRLDA